MGFLRVPLVAVALTAGLLHRSVAISLCHMMYLNADNDLEAAIVGDVEELLSNTAFISNSGYFLHVLIDRHDEFSNVVLKNSFDSSGAARTSENKGVVQYTYTGGKLTEVAGGALSGEVNMDSKETLKSFLNDVLPKCKTAGADTYFLQGGSHGVGWGGFGGDEKTRRMEAKAMRGSPAQKRRLAADALSNADFAAAIEDALVASAIPGGKLDMLGFDACLMSALSTMKAFQNVTKYLLASEATEPGHGWDYTMLNTSYSSIVDLGKNIIDGFISSMHDDPEEHQTPKLLTLLDLTAYPAFETKLEDFFTKVKQALDAGDQSVLTAVSRALDSSLRFQGAEDAEGSSGKSSKSALDFGDFLNNFGNACTAGDAALATARTELQAEYGKVIVYFKIGEGTPQKATGVHIWLPTLRAAWDSALGFYKRHMCSSTKHTGCAAYVLDMLPQAVGNFMETFYANQFTAQAQSSAWCTMPTMTLNSSQSATPLPGLPATPPSAGDVTQNENNCYDYAAGSLINAGQVKSESSQYQVEVLVGDHVTAVEGDLAVHVPSQSSHAILQQPRGEFDANKVSLLLPKYVFTVDGSAVTALHSDATATAFEVDVTYFLPGVNATIASNDLTNVNAGKMGYLSFSIDSEGNLSSDVSLFAKVGGSFAAVPKGQGKVVPIMHVSGSNGWKEHVTKAVDWAAGFKTKVKAMSFNSETAWTSLGMGLNPSTGVSVEVSIYADTEKSANTTCWGEDITTEFDVQITATPGDGDGDHDHDHGNGHADGDGDGDGDADHDNHSNHGHDHGSGTASGAVMSTLPTRGVMGELPLMLVSALLTLTCTQRSTDA